ncbi:MAG: hypothetical protein IT447_03820 [Phycisphaerales bacterium]|jgi:hypothetical protein|nr:hypothetical protein [Phycisphaerales bacterium]
MRSDNNIHQIDSHTFISEGARICRWDWGAAGVALLIFAGLSAYFAAASEGFLEADGCTHYLYARFAFAEPHYFANVWGRPWCTGLYAIPAAVAGLLGVRLMSLALALLCAIVAYQLAKEQGHRRPVLALILTLGQPLLFLHSFSELTEVPFAALLVLAFWAYQRRQWLVMALLASMLPLARPEGFGFIILAAVALLAARRWTWLLLLPVPLLLWNHAGWVLSGRNGVWWRWLIDNWPYSANSLYPAGNLFKFAALLPMLVSPLVFPMTCLGTWRNLRIAPTVHAFIHAAHRNRCIVLTALLPLLVLVGHSLLYWLGKMASNGELRYLLILASFWGILSARGWEWFFERFNWRRPVIWAGLAVLIPGGVNFYYHMLPIQPDSQWRRAKWVADWYENSPLRLEYPKLMAAHPGIFYFLDLSVNDTGRARQWNLETVRQAPGGTILIWDPIYGVYNATGDHSIHIKDLLDAGWIADPMVEARLNRPIDQPEAGHPLQKIEPSAGQWHIFLSPTNQSRRPTVIR